MKSEPTINIEPVIFLFSTTYSRPMKKNIKDSQAKIKFSKGSKDGLINFKTTKISVMIAIEILILRNKKSLLKF